MSRRWNQHRRSDGDGWGAFFSRTGRVWDSGSCLALADASCRDCHGLGGVIR